MVIIRRRCSNPKCDAAPGGKPRLVQGDHDWCRTCRMIARVKKNAQRARKRGEAAPTEMSA